MVGIRKYKNIARPLSKTLSRWSEPLWCEEKWLDHRKRLADIWARFLSIGRLRRKDGLRYLKKERKKVGEIFRGKQKFLFDPKDAFFKTRSNIKAVKS